STNYIHLRCQQRNGRKPLTTVQGLPKAYNAKSIVISLKKEFACNGTVTVDEEYNAILQFTGDHRTKITTYLVQEGIAKESEIKVHGLKH
ncbi:eIF1-like protein, partial [Backusella circina FSU 941]